MKFIVRGHPASHPGMCERGFVNDFVIYRHQNDNSVKAIRWRSNVVGFRRLKLAFTRKYKSAVGLGRLWLLLLLWRDGVVNGSVDGEGRR